MNNARKTLALLTAASIVIGTSACGGGGRGEGDTTTSVTTTPSVTVDPNADLDNVIDYDDMANIGGVDKENEEGVGKLYESGKTAGLVKALCYYDVVADQPEISEIFATRYGGTVETTICTSLEYFDKLGTLIASGESPDLVRYDWQACPDGIIKGRYLALDDWLDIKSPLWTDIEDVIESFAYKGKHYYFPQNVMSNFAIIYDANVIEENNLKDPMELYFSGNWTWDEFEEMMVSWSQKGDEYVGFTGGSWSSMMFINTTGTKTIDFTGSEIINNLQSPDAYRTMTWLEKLKSDGLIGTGYIHPEEAFKDGTLLFLAMGLEWGLESAQKTSFNGQLGQDIVAVPFPRDPNSDTYYLASDTLGYMVPAGAKNVQGAVQWILSSRLYETDPDVVQERRDELMSTDPIFYPKCPGCKYSFTDNNCDDLTVCPECDSPRKEKFKVTYSEEQMQIIDDMINPEKFTFIYDNANGFSNDFCEIFINGEDAVFDGPIYSDVYTYTQLVEQFNNSIEATLQPYRDLIAE